MYSKQDSSSLRKYLAQLIFFFNSSPRSLKSVSGSLRVRYPNWGRPDEQEAVYSGIARQMNVKLPRSLQRVFN